MPSHPQTAYLQVGNFDDFIAAPEAAMDCHFAVEYGADDVLVLVIGCRLAIKLPAALENSVNLPGLSEETLEGWHGSLEERHFQPLSPVQLEEFLRRGDASWRESRLFSGAVTPIASLPPTPWRASSIYGHLPFYITSDSDSVFYRWEAFSQSRRVTEISSGVWEVAAATFGAPASEVPFVPTGFGAVGRFALPSLLPHVYRLELQPIAGTRVECGASVPLYGQSGGGVEVRFANRTKMRSPVAHPVKLPPL